MLTLYDGPETLTEWKSEILTYGRTDGHLRWVGAKYSLETFGGITLNNIEAFVKPPNLPTKTAFFGNPPIPMTHLHFFAPLEF